LRLRTKYDTKPVVYDMLTGQRQFVKMKTGGVVLLEVKLAPFWGRAFALLPAEPDGLNVTVASDQVQSDRTVKCEVQVVDGKKRVVSARLPVEVKVTDASGRLREEYSGARVLDNGRLLLPLELGTNDPAGKWRIEVKQPWTGLKGQAVFRVEN